MYSFIQYWAIWNSQNIFKVLLDDFQLDVGNTRANYNLSLLELLQFLCIWYL